MCWVMKLKTGLTIYVLSLIIGLVLPACSISQEVREISVIDPDEILVKRFPHTAYVSYLGDFNKKTISLYPEDESTAIDFGEKLKVSLFKAVSLAYEDVDIADNMRIKENLSRIIQFKIEECRIVFADELLRNDVNEGGLSPLKLTVIAAAVSVSIYGENYSSANKEVVIKASSRFFRNPERKKEIVEFRKAVDMVIQRISYDTANLLLEGFAEPEHESHTGVNNFFE